MVHKKSTLYYPKANGLAESTNKTLQNILQKIVNENRTDWDTSFKTSVQATPFRLAYGLGAVMPVEFQISSLGIQVNDRMREGASEQVCLQQLLTLGETHVHSLAVFELDQQRHKAFVDRHRGQNEKLFAIGKPVLVFQTRMSKMHGKPRFRWTGPYWIVAVENGTFTLNTLAGEILPQKINGFRLKPYVGATPPNRFEKTTDHTPPEAGSLRGE